MDGAEDLRAVLHDARDAGLLGPGPVDVHLAHAETFARLVGPPAGPALDLGSGGGLPGLVLAFAWPEARLTLLDTKRRAGDFLEGAVDRLGLADRVDVLVARAEDAARDPARRGTTALVVARSFGPPAVTAECAVGLLRPGGRLAVSEPPDTDPALRWPEDGIAQLGLTSPEIRHADSTTVALLTLTDASADRWPRRPGIPAKRPLWA